MEKSNKFTVIYRIAVICILLVILYQVVETHKEVQDKLKYDLEFVKSTQSELREGVADVQQKLKYDLEFIKANQATLHENHDILVDIMNDRKKRK